MTRRPLFWLVFGALGLAGAVTAVLLFSRALPSISVDIEMDREAALDSAASLAARYSWGEAEDRAAASFGLADDLVQTFVELEGGGAEAVERLAEENVYQAYQWRVRRFAEGRVEEHLTRFTPQGEPYGFSSRLPEDEPGTGNLTSSEARAAAEATAREWGVDLALYRPSESSAETLPGGRVDHTFVYERTEDGIGDTPFLLRLRVAGSRPSELTHFVRVPEAFSRRYADMRSTNDTIALVAQGVLLLVFVLLGAGVGSALLLRQRWLEWRAPLAWGAVIAFAFGAAAVNRLPLSWASYDTALSATTFVLQQVAGGVAIVLLGSPLIAFFLLAGESLGRKAFPGHVQQWRFWSGEVASSTTALGMTAAAYLLVGLQVGYVVLFYLGTRELEGWWSPADALVQPDLLATYLPWLEAVSLALFAAFWEESAFRAVPIACAALLGSRFGRRGVWIWGAVLLQALVFAAGHANYPQQPPYARVVELMAPALLWGAVYVRFGLVPTILAHFLYDLALISVVLFESNAAFDQAVIVAFGLLPLGVVVAQRLRHGSRALPPAWAMNGAWTPPEPAGTAEERVVESERADGEVVRATRPGQAGAAATEAVTEVSRTALPRWSVAVAVGVGCVATLAAVLLRDAPPSLWGNRAAAVDAARTELASRGVAVDEWTVHVTTASGATQGRDYVFEEAGPEAFEELQGLYFGTPRWVIRLVDWDEEPESRVEEYRAWVGPSGTVERVAHTLPEGRPGAALDVERARALALAELEREAGLEAGDLSEVEAVEIGRPARTDWLFTFSEVERLTEVAGEARLEVRIAGDEVVDVSRTIHVPEAWERARRRVENRTTIMLGGLGLLLLIGFVAAAVTGVVVWSRRGLPAGSLWKLSGLAFLVLVASSVNDWPQTAAAFSTAQPWSFQAGATALALLLVACVAAPAVGLVAALAQTWLRDAGLRPTPARAGPAFGFLFGAVALAAAGLTPGPETGSYFAAASLVPLLAPALAVVPALLLLGCSVLVFVALGRRFGHHAFVRTTLGSLLVAIGVVVVPPELQGSWLTWAGGASVVLVGLGLAVAVAAARPVIVPGMVAAALVVQTLGTTWTGPYEGARLGGLVAVLALALVSWAWTRELAQSPEETPASVGSE